MSDYDAEDLRQRSLSSSNTFEGMVEAHLSRRGFLVGAGAVAATAAAASVLTVGIPSQALAATGFTAVAETTADTVTVPPGYGFNTLLAWGDPLFPGDAAWGNGPGQVNGGNITADEQERRVGFNHDMLALYANPFGSPASTGGQPHPAYIAVFNQEYTTGDAMFPGYTGGAAATRRQIDVEIAAHGITVAGIRLAGGTWSHDASMRVGDVAEGALVARRITGSTRFTLDGPARDDARLAGAVSGTLNNCAGGFTPWGTYLSAEENFNQYFANTNALPAGQTKTNFQILGMTGGASSRRWEKYHDRFDLAKMPNEGFKFGWIVEVDPYDPTRRPVKHTALGRFKHECATIVVQYPTGATKGKVVAYSGDDQQFDYVYKFVTDGTFDRENPRAKGHFSLLSSGTLYVAKFNADGTGQWLPLTHANVNGVASGAFADQADICIRTREAADVLGATPMDRPEDVEAPHDPVTFAGTGKVFVVCTNNSSRGGSATAANRPGGGATRSSATDAANPRVNNRTGHIVQINEAGNDHTATTFTWNLYLLAGDPKAAAGAVGDVKDTFFGDRFGSPDNITFDNRGLLWIATDGNPSSYPCNDQVLCTEVAGNGKVRVKRFLVGPAGCEVCGPLFAPDNTTFFCNIQHPGEGPSSTFPDGGLPRPAMVAVRRTDGGIIGS